MYYTLSNEVWETESAKKKLKKKKNIIYLGEQNQRSIAAYREKKANSKYS